MGSDRPASRPWRNTQMYTPDRSCAPRTASAQFLATMPPMRGGHVMTLLRSRMFVAAIAFVMPVVAQAQDSPQRKELRRVDLSGAAGMEVLSSITESRPGDKLPRNLHHHLWARDSIA